MVIAAILLSTGLWTSNDAADAADAAVAAVAASAAVSEWIHTESIKINASRRVSSRCRSEMG